MYRMAKNLGFAVRQLRKAPGFAATVVLTLALGIGATTAIFSIVEGVLLRPLPFRDADRLVLVGDHLGNNPGISVTAREIATYSASAQAFSSIGGFIQTSYELSGGAQPEEVRAARLTAEVFPTLGGEPLLGRVFTRDEETSQQPVAVLSYALWLERYHRDPHVVGATITLDRRTYTIIGVMPRDFEFPLQPGRVQQTQLWVPLSLTPDELSDRNMGFWGYGLIGRLRPGVSYAQAAQDADRIAHQVMQDFPPSMAKLRLRGDVDPLRENALSEIRPLLRTLFGAVSVVLLIACANVAGLLLVRAIRRRREYAVRLALGAPSSAITGESLLEGLVLSVTGGLIGLGFAAAALRVTLRLLPESVPRIDAISLNGKVAGFALLLAIATGVLCSIAPAFAALGTNVADALKESVRTSSGGTSHTWLRGALVVSEIAIALVLLTVSGALLRSFQNMRAVDPGFRPEHVLVAKYQLPLTQYGNEAVVDTFNRSIVERLSAKPGVTSVGITNALPGFSSFGLAAYTIEDQPVESWKLQFAAFSFLYGDYFGAMRIPVLEGRTFTERDRGDAPLVIVVNQSMARHCWPGKSPIGRRMHVGNPQKGYPWATVVGVVGDTKLGGRDQPSQDQWYLPGEQPAILQGTQRSAKLTSPASAYITLRSALAPEQMAQTLRSTVAEIDPLLALNQVEPMTEALSNVEAPRRFNTSLISTFAGGALLLAITGIYAVVAFSVSQRTQEIAIRMALGAQRRGIARLVLASGAKLALLGCGAGLVASVGVSRLVASFLFNVSATDPLIYAVSVVLMTAMALAASALPAVRAAGVNPIEALRSI
jgi:predicted permease